MTMLITVCIARCGDRAGGRGPTGGRPDNRARPWLADLPRARRVATLLLVALCVPLAWSTATAEAAGVWRGTTLNAFGYGPAAAQQDLDSNQQAGANAVRIDIGWANLEPDADGTIDAAYVAQVDDYIHQAASRGLKVIAIVQGTPCWASSAPESLRQSCDGDWRGRGVAAYPPVRPSDYADAAAYIARRWAPQLAGLEVWNEPNNTTFLRSSNPARDYALLLEAAYPAIKAAAPGLPVVGGALVYSDRDFLEALYAQGIHGSFDAFSIHPYDNPRAAPQYGPKYHFAEGVPWVREGMVAHGDGDKALWLTEFGWPTCPPALFDWCVSESEQAGKLTGAFHTAAGWPYVGAEIIYTLRDPGSDPANWQDHMGLLRTDYSPKPAWDAFIRALAEPPASPPGAPPTSPPTALSSVPRPPAPPNAAGHRGLLVTRARLLRGGRRLRVWLTCAGPSRCPGLLRVSRSGRRQPTLASRRVSLAAGRQGFVTFTLPRRARLSQLAIILSSLPRS